VAHKCQRPENPQHNSFKLLCCGFSGRWHFWVTVVCVVLWVPTTQQFHFVVLPKNPQHNNLKLLCCRFSGRWHLWATALHLANTVVLIGRPMYKRHGLRLPIQPGCGVGPKRAVQTPHCERCVARVCCKSARHWTMVAP